MKSKLGVVLAMLAVMAFAGVASAAGPGTCGNVPPRDGTGQKYGQIHSFRAAAGPVAWLFGNWAFGGIGVLGWGPGDGTGNDGVGPLDGTGYGPGEQPGTVSGTCDGTGPHGVVTRNKR